MGKRHWIAIVGMIITLYACSKGGELVAAFVGFRQPANFPAPVYKLDANQITQAGFELGRKLFYEPRLSRNNTISCGDCHIQTSAFTHHGHDVSHGIDDRLGSRNAPPMMNLAWQPSYMLDGGVFDLDLQPIAPITNPVEMDEKLDNVLNKLRAHPQYPALFKKAFGTEEITTARMMKAMSQFMVMLVSADAKYDQVVRGEGATFTADEKAGYAIYQQKCSACHTEPMFSDYSFRNNGIGIGPNNDEGRYPITLNPADKYKFKVPSLRNLQYTAPYMHDGRFYTLDGVLDHYASEVQDMPTLDPLLKKNGKRGIDLTATDKRLLLAFLNTLNDKKFITDKRFSEQAQ
ncbi:cytochrome-c peroxidase [Chitinophaga nivalis]|uniref:Cytochrome-c peroxidase n=1 Tax=Chitinophaga nivalis TaxID=2991709 RepID=A0ABT3IJ84_9BACT|nr:cytochrome c peroxidase [Chitinophaga nivalis]MCW3466305.1 cytochrome-c peroxidase [Chitinophaga nivalis]MCW3484004.1 cytochrome-c peroxidase [Chitinophaga nivalis]